MLRLLGWRVEEENKNPVVDEVKDQNFTLPFEDGSEIRCRN
jgi:hypothetical protein